MPRVNGSFSAARGFWLTTPQTRMACPCSRRHPDPGIAPDPPPDCGWSAQGSACWFSGTQVTKDRDSVHARKVRVEHEEVIIHLPGHRPRLFAVAGDIHRVMFCF